MTVRTSRSICVCLAVITLTVAGCAHLAPTARLEPLSLQRPDEQPAMSRSGRFVVHASRTALQPTDHGAQGHFEWLEFRSGPDKARQLLLFLNPLGQSGPSLERELVMDRTSAFSNEQAWRPDTVRVFDEQGQPLVDDAQRQLIAQLIGLEASEQISDTQIAALLTSVMNLFATTSMEREMLHHRVYTSSSLELNVRVAYDTALPSSDITGAASR